MKSMIAFSCFLFFVIAALPAAEHKPVLLYSRYFNAAGESRYLPQGTFKKILDQLSNDYEVRIHSNALTQASLKGVDAVLIANPSDKAAGTNPAPHHVSAKDISALTRYVNDGGALVIMGNQENHNLEIDDMNRLLTRFGLQLTNAYTDAKRLVIPKSTPIVGGLVWAYYTGNSILVDRAHPAKPRDLVPNDLSQKPLKGPRDHPGSLLATAEPGRGHVILVTDSGWLTDAALEDKGIGDIVLKDHNNEEILRRLLSWATRH